MTAHVTKSKLFKLGLFFIVPLMLILLYLSGLKMYQRGIQDDESIFSFTNYIIAVVYFLIILFQNKPFFKPWLIKREYIILVLTMFSISCFSMNNVIPLFSSFTSWVYVYLCTFYIAYVGICYVDYLSKYLRYLLFYLLGSGVVLISYFALFLLPDLFIGIVGLMFLGLTFHIFVPLLIWIDVFKNLSKTEKNKTEIRTFILGIITPLIFLFIFLFSWSDTHNDYLDTYQKVEEQKEKILPDWVVLSEYLSVSEMGKKVLIGNYKYDNVIFEFFSFNNRNRLNFKREHNPLVAIAMMLYPSDEINGQDRVRILKSMYDKRHIAQRKLWSDQDLITHKVKNTIEVYPEYRLAYTEKEITIKNQNKYSFIEQEAAYSFYLPEGSVATSLSLWINGKEEKSRLTTKSKADSAYVEIVGVEMRDPALMHWQEGNVLTVTVFPCTAAKDRIFKIGVTTPLRKEKEKLHLESVYFDGPAFVETDEETTVRFISDRPIKSLDIPSFFDESEGQTFHYKGSIKPYFEIGCLAPKVSSNTFSFDGFAYEMLEVQKEEFAFNPDQIYLDINKSWSKEEFDHLLKTFRDKEVFVYHHQFISLDTENKDELFKELSKRNFSLFPFFKLIDKNALIVSKSTAISPNFSDLEGSEFRRLSIQNYQLMKKSLNVVHLNTTLSPYLKTLQEYQVVNLQKMDLNQLDGLVRKENFLKYPMDETVTSLPKSEIAILKSKSEKNISDAPDHLMRLFTYGQVMQKLGRSQFNNDKVSLVEDLMVDIEKAFIVTPVSSLVVLETKEDYDRFGIEENKNSLKNAAIDSSGAIPEPEEWALILLFISIIGFIFYQKIKKVNIRWR
ncbi:XrtN system VIT domain-containing protein [Flammeovirga sp. MY04]|nr:XrtN system VIT domain-containing protein [Flammeovirga sp. MY04]ANQ49738.2 XrtN system VIT domain-containing protein [Flammeovirga sp. MY04]